MRIVRLPSITDLSRSCYRTRFPGAFTKMARTVLSRLAEMVDPMSQE